MKRPRVHLVRCDWIVPEGYGGLTLGRWIFIRRNVDVTVAWLAHELMHVLQWRRLGVVGFLWQYGWTFFRDGMRYRNIDLEEEARNPTPYALVWAQDLISAGRT